MRPYRSSWIARTLRGGALGLACVMALGCATWALGGLYFDLPAARILGAGLFVIVLLAALIFVRGPWRKVGSVMLGFAIVLAWWWTLKASNDRPWQADVAQTAWAETNGDNITLHNVRNCEYRTETAFTPRWETRAVRLSPLTSVDL